MDFMKEYEKWLASPALSDAERAELESIRNDPKEIESRFYGPLEFGTAGLRGIMAVGLHNMNIHVIRWATQGFAQVICAEGEEGKRRGVAICMDCRNHSMEFARAAAEVCAANGIHVRIFESLRPTPELSFAVREYRCQAGINVTASHNPKEYNGYKVYWEDGAQLPPHHADAIAAALEQIDVFNGIRRMDFDEAVKAGLIETMGEETDRKFMANVTAMINDKETVAKVADTFKLVYTPFHGCGYKLVPEALRTLGIKHLICEPKQMVIDGDFPTVVSPNPENPEGFYLAIDLARENDVDFILGTDPDSDRVGIMIRDHSGEYRPVTGNQTGVLLLDYLIGAMRRSGKMPEKPVALKTIVTTEMARKVAESNGVTCYDTFTGFKFMAEEKNALEAERTAKNRAGQEMNENLLNLERAVAKLDQKRATSAMEEKQILDRLWEHYELSHSDAQAQRIELESVPKANRRIGELKRDITALGTPNIGAIDEFQRVNTRYTYLTDQRNDVEKAKGELQNIIGEITEEMTKIFAEQFKLLSESFQTTFQELFGGGTARLELEDEEDILGCGIEIKAQPPGKTLKTISLLSGGEKAFVAIALYFSILKVHPTPFCVMDEIEAALDDANVTRYARYMRTLAGRTQFIVITHRRGTMEEADVLYGVTMQEQGVSKILTINLNDMAKELKIK